MIQRLLIKKIACWVALLLVQPCFAQVVYKGIDPKGNVIYSDKPFPNSTPVTLAPLQTYSAPPVTPTTINTPIKAPEKQYVVTILTPTNDQMIGHEFQTVDVTLLIEPHLNHTDHVELLLNGESYGIYDSNSMQLKDLPRGAYRLQANIISGGANKVIAQSPAVTFYQQRVSAIKPH